jgi:hypothetical protein
VLLLAGAVFVLPHLLAPPQNLAGAQGLSDKDRIQFADDSRKLQNDVRASLLQAIAGGAVLIGVLFTWQQQQATSRQIADQLAVTRQGQVGERFSRAVSQLGSNSIDVRLGGLYELEQLARQAPERRLVILEVVAAYIRQHAQPPANAIEPQTPLPSQDVAAALTIISRPPIYEDYLGVDLREVDFGRVDLSQYHLSGAVLVGANLNGAKLSEADLRGAELGEADLRDADLSGANLNAATLYNADLRGTDLTGADLQSGRLNGADFRGADLTATDLSGATADDFTRWPDGFDARSAGVTVY